MPEAFELHHSCLTCTSARLVMDKGSHWEPAFSELDCHLDFPAPEDSKSGVSNPNDPDITEYFDIACDCSCYQPIADEETIHVLNLLILTAHNLHQAIGDVLDAQIQEDPDNSQGFDDDAAEYFVQL